MNFDDTIGLDEIEKMGNWVNFQNPDDLEKLINLIKQFESYESRPIMRHTF